MSRRIALLAALPRELKPLVRGWKRVPAPRYVSMWTQVDASGDEIIAACAGMGASAVQRAFAAAESLGSLDLVISLGLAGATSHELRLGEVSSLNEVIDVQTGERFPLSPNARKLRIATVTQTANAREKARLLASYGAIMVDMEAATVARLARMRDLPMCCFKAVSDDAGDELPEIDRFVDGEGQLQTGRFVLHLLGHPGSWRGVARLARSSESAASALAEKTREFLRHKDWEYTHRSGAFLWDGERASDR